ncbi:MAG: hypothetical protein WCV81_02050 [Microgenomates group bacterium]|jgi:hypothetical protein
MKNEASKEASVNFLSGEKFTDLGLSARDIALTRKVLQTLKKHSDYPAGYDIALKQVLDEQDRALGFKALERELKMSQVQHTRKSLGQIALRAAGVVTVVAAMWGIYSCSDSYNSPEAVEKRVAQNAINQENERAKKEQEFISKSQLEGERTLGLERSPISNTGFSFRYMPKKEGVRYVEVGGTYNSFNIGKASYVNWKEEKSPKETVDIVTWIFTDTYTRVKDGKVVPQLTIDLLGDKRTFEKRYLRIESTEDIDNSMLIFEDVKKNKEYIFKVTPVNDMTTLQFVLVREEAVDGS